jgi:cystathionine gamma-synthase
MRPSSAMIQAMHRETMLAHGLVDDPDGSLSPVLDRSVTFEEWPPSPEHPSPYGRGRSRTVAALENLLSSLESADALAFSSGMTAWAVLALTVLAPGEAVVVPGQGYYGTSTLSRDLLGRFGVTVHTYDPADMDAFARACQGSRLALVESPANPQLSVIDISAAAAAAHEADALLVCDNTVATPLLQQPLELGADVAWQSATKYLSGHSDVLAGVLSTRDGELLARLRGTRTELGAILAPDPAWLLLRGLRSLGVRLERQCSTALLVATRLSEHPRVVAVHYPGLPSAPGHEVAARQMHGGFGALMAFELADAAAAERVEERLRLIRRATSLGAVESLIERRGRIEPEGRVPAGLLRLSIGLEHPEDLWGDLQQALDAA